MEGESLHKNVASPRYWIAMIWFMRAHPRAHSFTAGLLVLIKADGINAII